MTYKYNLSDNTLWAEVEAPKLFISMGNAASETLKYEQALREYNSRLRFPLPDQYKGHWEDGQGGLEEGKDFTWKYEFILGPPLHSTVWLECSKEEWDMTNPRYKRIVAIPIQPTPEVKTERFKRPTDQQIVNAAILFNDGKVEKKKLSDMVALCDFVIDRLYENGDMTIPSSKENK